MRRSARRLRLRPLLAFVIVVAVVAVFGVRLFTVQVVQAETLNQQSKGQRSVVVTVPGVRGTITDSSGTVLARTMPRYMITAAPKVAWLAGSSVVLADAQKIAKAAGQSAAAVTSALTKDPTSNYAVIAQQATLEQMNAVKALDIDWLVYQQVQKRVYPNGSVAGNLVGFVGSAGEAQAGIEYSANACLKGATGTTTYEGALDGTAIPGTAVTTKKARQGGTVKLTINDDLQWYTQKVLADQAKKVGASWGSVVVEEVATGKLLAVADWPTVDPNNVAATANTDTGALGSRAFTAPFEPGSTMKSVTTAGLLNAGLITTQTDVLAPYRLTTADGANVNDSEYHADERLTTTGVLIQSSNTGMSKLGLRMSAKDRYKNLLKFGFGTPTAVGFGAEASGDLGADAPNWDPQSNLATMFGQGLTVSAVQMASAYATIANGGVREPLSLVESCTAADGTVTTPAKPAATRAVSSSAAKQTVTMLENVATQGWLSADVKIPGYRIAIKTGTAQESNGKGSYSKGYLVSMAGMAPAESPKYVVYVDLDNPVKMNTSQATAPVFRQVMSRVLQQYGVVPSGTSSPYLAAGY